MSVNISSPVAGPTIAKWKVASVRYEVGVQCDAEVHFLTSAGALVALGHVILRDGQCYGLEIGPNGHVVPIEVDLPTGLSDYRDSVDGCPCSSMETYLNGTALLP